MGMRAKPWDVSDGLWERIEPLLPKRERRFRYPGRKPFDDRLVLQGILFVLHTGIGWEHLPQELGFGCGMTAWRRLHEWRQAGVWQRLHELLLAELHAAGLGRDRWVVERSFAWLHNRRRLLLRTDRRHETQEAFLDLACCLICWRRVETSFS